MATIHDHGAHQICIVTSGSRRRKYLKTVESVLGKRFFRGMDHRRRRFTDARKIIDEYRLIFLITALIAKIASRPRRRYSRFPFGVDGLAIKDGFLVNLDGHLVFALIF